MARIRTIKPEFWTDEVIVQLPFEARLLFIGMWNFADDDGSLDYRPDRLRLQILPSEHNCDITGLIDLLAACGLIDYWANEEGTQVITIRNWHKHQKVDNPSRKKIPRESYRKKAIPTESRVGVAKKYGCKAGCEANAECYYCGMPGKIKWWTGSNGKPTRWITLSDLEFDHFISEHSGGDNSSENIVLACRSCNRGKREFDPRQFFETKNPSIVVSSPREPSTLDQGKDQGSRKGSRIKDQGEDQGKEGGAVAPPLEDPPDDWILPDGWDTPELRASLDRFEAMRKRIKKPIRSKRNTSVMFPKFDSPEHLIYAADLCVGNEYQGLKPDYRAPPTTQEKQSKQQQTFQQIKGENTRRVISNVIGEIFGEAEPVASIEGN
jgi:5-methylcytosine-specific restriction endonuclease McrA